MLKNTIHNKAHPDLGRANIKPRLSSPVCYRRPYARQNQQGWLSQISSQGAFLETPNENPEQIHRLKLVFHVASRKRSIEATVKWRNHKGLGLRFHHGSKQDAQIIDDFIYFLENSQKNKKNTLESIFKQVA